MNSEETNGNNVVNDRLQKMVSNQKRFLVNILPN